MSLLLYKELIMMSMRRDTSAWNSNFSALLRRDLFEIDSDSLQPQFDGKYVINFPKQGESMVNVCINRIRYSRTS